MLDFQAAAAADPRGFLASFPPPVIFDEIQHAPDLLPYIKERIDSERTSPGRFLLSGSQNLLLSARVTESLAGRAAILKLLPLSFREAAGMPERPLPWERTEAQVPALFPAGRLWPALLRGGYPELAANPDRDVALWQSSYVQTYLERDVRMLRQVGDLISFQAFLRALAARSGQLFHLSDIARDLGVAVNTVKAWLSVLEATYQVVVLRPYFANVGKRLVKSPKVYFTDTGLLCHLVGLRDPEHAARGPLGGAILETAVLSELIRTFVHRAEEPQVYFWRTAAGVEVDFVIESGGKVIPIEVKLTATPRPILAQHIERFRRDFPGQTGPAYVIHAGDVSLPLAPGITALPLCFL